jgi:hypothetical protein
MPLPEQLGTIQTKIDTFWTASGNNKSLLYK